MAQFVGGRVTSVRGWDIHVYEDMYVTQHDDSVMSLELAPILRLTNSYSTGICTYVVFSHKISQNVNVVSAKFSF